MTIENVFPPDEQREIADAAFAGYVRESTNAPIVEASQDVKDSLARALQRSIAKSALKHGLSEAEVLVTVYAAVKPEIIEDTYKEK